MHAFFLLNMRAIISQHVMINHERICQATHFGVQLIRTLKVLEFVEIVALKVRTMIFDFVFILKHFSFLKVCRLPFGSACNIYGTNNCSTTLCNCKLENVGDLCQKCNWHEFYFASHGIDGTIDEINGYGVTCKKGILKNVLKL